MAADSAKKPATYQDVLDAPEHLVAEIVAGESYRLVAVHGEAEVVRLEPFDAIELELEALWPGAG